MGNNIKPGVRQSCPLESEWRLLELVSLGSWDHTTTKEFEHILNLPTLDWGEVLHQAIRHKLLPLLALEIITNHLMTSIPRTVAGHLVQSLRINRHRLNLYRMEVVRVSNALKAAGVRFACTKGMTFESTVYGGGGGRTMSDIDFMFVPQHSNSILKVMKELGYERGFYQSHLDSSHLFTREELIAFKLNDDHLAPFVRTIDDPIVPSIEVDFASSLTWARSPYQVPIEHALSATREQIVPCIANATIPTLSPIYQFLFTVLHLFREAWIFKWVELEQDVNLIKFGDVIRLWRNDLDKSSRQRFKHVLTEYDVVEPVAWVLVHTDRTFGTNIASIIGIEAEVSEAYLHSAATTLPLHQYWHCTMKQRLQSKSRVDLFH